MELAIPLVTLGALYLGSNQENKKEGYESMGKHVNALPNNNVPPVNYPILKNVKDTNVNKYNDPNTVTDKYFNPSIYKK